MSSHRLCHRFNGNVTSLETENGDKVEADKSLHLSHYFHQKVPVTGVTSLFSIFAHAHTRTCTGFGEKSGDTGAARMKSAASQWLGRHQRVTNPRFETGDCVMTPPALPKARS